MPIYCGNFGCLFDLLEIQYHVLNGVCLAILISGEINHQCKSWLIRHLSIRTKDKFQQTKNRQLRFEDLSAVSLSDMSVGEHHNMNLYSSHKTSNVSPCRTISVVVRFVLLMTTLMPKHFGSRTYICICCI